VPTTPIIPQQSVFSCWKADKDAAAANAAAAVAAMKRAVEKEEEKPSSENDVADDDAKVETANRRWSINDGFKSLLVTFGLFLDETR
jgi:hypothetical protein